MRSVAAVVVVGLVVGGALAHLVLGRAGKSTARASASTGASAGPGPTPVVDLARAGHAVASSTDTPSKDSGGRSVSYSAQNLVDGDTATTWRTVGDGRGVTLTITLARPAVITGLAMTNGYPKMDPVSGVDRYTEERRVLTVTYAFSSGARGTVRLADGDRGLQQLSVPTVTSDSVTLTIDSTTPPGSPDHDRTAVSEIQVLGH